MQRFRAAMAALAFLLLTAGAACRTDYTDDAVEKAPGLMRWSAPKT